MADSTNSLRKRVSSARRELFERLLAQRNECGHWTGELSTSALSTATATLALWLVDTARVGSSSASLSHNELVHGGLRWLVEHVNSDGGWGDTTRSHSNLSTTTLCWATVQAAQGTMRQYQSAIDRAEDWIRRRTTSLDPAKLAEAVTAVYGKDRTFSVPILTHCSLAGCLGPTPACWGYVRSLPFELAALVVQECRLTRGELRAPCLNCSRSSASPPPAEPQPLRASFASTDKATDSRSHERNPTDERWVSRSDSSHVLRDDEPGR